MNVDGDVAGQAKEAAIPLTADLRVIQHASLRSSNSLKACS